MSNKRVDGLRLYLALDGDASIYGFCGEIRDPQDSHMLVYTGSCRKEGDIDFTLVTLAHAVYELRDGWIDITYDDGRYVQRVAIPAVHVRAVRYCEV